MSSKAIPHSEMQMLLAGVAFDAALTKDDKRHAFHKMMESCKAMYEANDIRDDIAGAFSAGEYPDFDSHGWETCSDTVRTIASITALGLAAGFYIEHNPGAYNAILDKLSNDYLHENSNADYFAAAVAVSMDMSVGLARHYPMAALRSMDLALHLELCLANQHHFSNLNGKTNQDRALSLARLSIEGAKHCYAQKILQRDVNAKNPYGVQASDLVELMAQKYTILFCRGDVEGMQTEMQMDQQDPALIKATHEANKQEMVTDLYRGVEEADDNELSPMIGLPGFAAGVLRA